MTIPDFGTFIQLAVKAEGTEKLGGIIHIGANTAETTYAYNRFNPEHIYWVEPILVKRSVAEYYHLIYANFKWTWIPRALASYDGTTKINKLVAKCNTLGGLAKEFSIQREKVTLLCIEAPYLNVGLDLSEFPSLNMVLIKKPTDLIVDSLESFNIFPKAENGDYMGLVRI